MMSTTASIGKPDVTDVFPPKRSGRLVPAPAWWQNWTATGSLYNYIRAGVNNKINQFEHAGSRVISPSVSAD